MQCSKYIIWGKGLRIELSTCCSSSQTMGNFQAKDDLIAFHVTRCMLNKKRYGAISMNSALADKEFVLSLHHKLHVSTCINKPNDVHKHNQSIIHSINQSFLHKQQ